MDRIWELAVILGLFVGAPAVFCWLMRGLEASNRQAPTDSQNQLAKSAPGRQNRHIESATGERHDNTGKHQERSPSSSS